MATQVICRLNMCQLSPLWSLKDIAELAENTIITPNASIINTVIKNVKSMFDFFKIFAPFGYNIIFKK